MRAAAAGGAAGYVVSKVGPLLVPPGRSVVIRDPAVLAGLPQKKPDRIALSAQVGASDEPPSGIRVGAAGAGEKAAGEGGGALDAIWDALVSPLGGSSATSGCPRACRQSDGPLDLDESLPPTVLHIPALAASFGPSIVHRADDTIPPGLSPPFMLDGPAFPLTLPAFDPYGCEPHHPSSSSSSSGAPQGALVLLHRGHCSFALKAHHAALSGARGVVLVSSASPSASDAEGDEFVVPSADPDEEDDETMRALVPLVLVANSTGAELERMVRGVMLPAEEEEEEERGRRQQRQVWVTITHAEDEDGAEEEEEEAGLMLGGYLVRNVKLHRGRARRRPAAAPVGP